MGHLKPTIITFIFSKIESKVFGYPTIKKFRTRPHELHKDFLESLYQPSQSVKAWSLSSKKQQSSCG